jgi:hypothetical protein
MTGVERIQSNFRVEVRLAGYITIRGLSDVETREESRERGQCEVSLALKGGQGMGPQYEGSGILGGLGVGRRLKLWIASGNG